MSRHPTATREDHDRFCTTERWELVRGAAGRPVRHHRTYELRLWDARVLRTRISRPVDGTDYGRSVWSHILAHQLEVDADAFWACVDDAVLPDRGRPPREPSHEPLPMYLVTQLRERSVPDAEILALDPAAATRLLASLMLEEQGDEQDEGRG